MEIDIWTDIVCPFCYLGRRRFEQALATFEHRDEVTVRWHSFELDRNAPAVAEGSLADSLASKYGISREQADEQQAALAAQAAGLDIEFNWDRARSGNTFDAHRLVHYAEQEGGLAGAAAAHERLLKAYFTDGIAIGDRDTLAALAPEIGLDSAEVAAMLGSDDFGNHVRSDEATAKMLGVTSVPFFVIDRRYGVAGAQPVESFQQALAQGWATKDDEREAAVGGGCGGCGPDGCGGACAR